jgi:hypothetical protein
VMYCIVILKCYLSGTFSTFHTHRLSIFFYFPKVGNTTFCYSHCYVFDILKNPDKSSGKNITKFVYNNEIFFFLFIRLFLLVRAVSRTVLHSG